MAKNGFKYLNKRIRTYDFDEIEAFTLRLLFELQNKDPFALVRWSSGGKGLHVETACDLSTFQCKGREKYSKIYGFDITFKSKRGKDVSAWIRIDLFLQEFIGKLHLFAFGRKAKVFK